MHSIKMVTATIIHSQCLKNSLISPSPLSIPLPWETESFQTSALSPTVQNDASQSTGLAPDRLPTSVSKDVGWWDGDLKPHSHAWHSLYSHSQLLHRPAKLFAKVISISICLSLKLIRHIFKFHSNPHKSFPSLISHCTWSGPHSLEFSALSIFHIGLWLS